MQEFLAFVVGTSIVIWAFLPHKNCGCRDCNCYLKN